ncbi:MAG: hypothetical protein KJ674_02215 [Nanoarchaeota archaeon]|nr:hypothetical protein [Nanoarchaeota archaeon]
MKKLVFIVFVLFFISGCDYLERLGEKEAVGRQMPPQPEPDICMDTDGGLNYYIQGTVTDKNGNVVTDLCINETLLHEYECIENGDYNAVDYSCECDGGACNPCKILVEATDSIKPMNFIFVPINYQQNQIFYNNPYNLLDYSVNFENDIYRFLYSNNEIEGYGLLNVEPFVSRLDRINIYMYAVANQFEEQNYVVYYSNALSENCGFDATNSFAYGIIGEHQSIHPIWGGGLWYFSSSHRELFNGYMGVVTTFRHELGHEIASRDIYGPSYYYDEYIMNLWEDHQNNYEDFWDFYDNFYIVNYEQPNCDFTAGCPKWCSGDPLTNNIEEINPCQNYNTESECNAHGPGIIGGQDCIWFPSEHPYFETRCVRIDGGNTENIGTNCLEGAGCYFGCQGHGWRSHPAGNLAAQWIDNNNKIHGYDIPSENFIKNLFDCCHPENCVNYNHNECNEFFDKWEDKDLNYMDRYSCSGVCLVTTKYMD